VGDICWKWLTVLAEQEVSDVQTVFDEFLAHIFEHYSDFLAFIVKKPPLLNNIQVFIWD